MRRRRQLFALRVPRTPHDASDRLVPVAGCGCPTCVEARDRREAAREEQHWNRVAGIAGFDDGEDARD